MNCIDSKSRFSPTSLGVRAQGESERTSIRFVLFHVRSMEHIGDQTYVSKVYPWTEIQEATREMEANKNRYVSYRWNARDLGPNSK